MSGSVADSAASGATRPRRLALVLLIVSALLAAITACTDDGRARDLTPTPVIINGAPPTTPGSPASPTPTATPVTPASVTLIAVGDMMFDRSLRYRLTEFGPDSIFEADITHILHDADVTIGNLECAISERGEPLAKGYTFRAQGDERGGLERSGAGLRAEIRHVPEGSHHQSVWTPNSLNFSSLVTSSTSSASACAAISLSKGSRCDGSRRPASSAWANVTSRGRIWTASRAAWKSSISSGATPSFPSVYFHLISYAVTTETMKSVLGSAKRSRTKETIGVAPAIPRAAREYRLNSSLIAGIRGCGRRRLPCVEVFLRQRFKHALRRIGRRHACENT